MILYRKTPSLRVRRVAAPEPPFWFATAISPYGARRAVPLSVDYLALRASGAEKVEVTVCADPPAELERLSRLTSPILVDAAEGAEEVFRRGEATLDWCAAAELAAVALTSTGGPIVPGTAGHVIATWPLDLARLGTLFEAAAATGRPWGVFVPVLYPATTSIEPLNALAALAARHGARYLAAAGVEADPPARQALASALRVDEEEYATLFHADLEPLQIATERHVAALAAAHAMSDFVEPPGWPAPTNWNAAVLLTLTATRMLAMADEVELAGMLARAARNVASLEKPVERIAAAASLSIVEALDEVSVDILSEWIETGRASFVERINERWRVRRDHFAAP